MPRGKPGSWEHGTESGCRSGGCRLECCRAAHREYNAARREKTRTQSCKLPPNAPGQPGFASRERPHTRRAKGKTLEELLGEW